VPSAQLITLARRLGYRSRPRGIQRWVDVVVLVWLAWVFDAINNLGAVRQHLAEHHATQILDFERSLHLAPELALDTWLAAHRVLSEIVVFYYENVHAAVTFGVLAWLWWHRPDILAALRATLVIVNLVGLAVFWTFPVAPPRMLVGDGFVDLVALVHHVPVWRAGAISAQSNQLASLPSLHIAWAAWSALAVWRMSSRIWLRTLAVVYPLITTFAVMATGNHFLADAVAGVLITALVALLVDRVVARGARAPEPGRAGRALSVDPELEPERS
jgi:PAP2 superfamily